MRPEFLEVEDVLQIHADQLERYGELSGLRDHGLLLSAVAKGDAGKEAVEQFLRANSRPE